MRLGWRESPPAPGGLSVGGDPRAGSTPSDGRGELNAIASDFWFDNIYGYTYMYGMKCDLEIVLVFRTLSDPTRLRLLNLLSQGEVCVCHLSDTLDLTQPKVSRHLAYLKRGGFVETRRDGKWMHYRWSRQSHPLARVVLDGLRNWMARDDAMKRDRQKLKQVCC